jgi:hypothetical protein
MPSDARALESQDHRSPRSRPCGRNGNPLIDGRGGRRRMLGSMDVVDAERLQRSGVAMVGLKEEFIQKTK